MNTGTPSVWCAVDITYDAPCLALYGSVRNTILYPLSQTPYCPLFNALFIKCGVHAYHYRTQPTIRRNSNARPLAHQRRRPRIALTTRVQLLLWGACTAILFYMAACFELNIQWDVPSSALSVYLHHKTPLPQTQNNASIRICICTCIIWCVMYYQVFAFSNFLVDFWSAMCSCLNIFFLIETNF